jgi:hypothetical protein
MDSVGENLMPTKQSNNNPPQMPNRRLSLGQPDALHS